MTASKNDKKAQAGNETGTPSENFTLSFDHSTETDEDGAGVSIDNGGANILLQISDNLIESLNPEKTSTVWIQKKLVRRLIQNINKDDKEYFKLQNSNFLRDTDPVGNCDCNEKP